MRARRNARLKEVGFMGRHFMKITKNMFRERRGDGSFRNIPYTGRKTKVLYIVLLKDNIIFLETVEVILLNNNSFAMKFSFENKNSFRYVL